MSQIVEEWDEFEFTEHFLEEIAAHKLTLDDVKHVLQASNAKWVENRGDAGSGIAGHTASGACIYIPTATGEVRLLRPVTAYEVEQPRVLFNERDRRREKWERRKVRKNGR